MWQNNKRRKDASAKKLIAVKPRPMIAVAPQDTTGESIQPIVVKNVVGVTCPICRKNISRLTANVHLKYVHAHVDIADDLLPPLGGKWARNPIRCPICDTRMQVRRLAMHLRAKHDISYPAIAKQKAHKDEKIGSKMKRAPRSRPDMNRRGDVVVEIGRDSASEQHLDGSRGYHSLSREGGRFGSHVAHDDYGEEGEN